MREGKSRQMRNMIATGAAEGMQTIEMDLARLVAAGLITMETAMEVEPVPEGDPGAADDGSRATPGAGDDVDRPGRFVGRRHVRRRAGAGARCAPPAPVSVG